MKKLTVLLSLFLVGCFACSALAEQAEQPAAEGGKTLVAYFSATGNTKRIAEVIAGEAQADVLELIPEDPYTNEDLNWQDSESRASTEYANPQERDVKLVQATVDNWAEYDVVYIGYPIWWQIAAWPVNEFVQTNDFTGKTVIPFCTSGSSGFGESGTLLAEMAGEGNWVEGVRFSSGGGEESILNWMASFDWDAALAGSTNGTAEGNG